MSLLTIIADAIVFLPLIFGSNEVKIGSRVEIAVNAQVGAQVQAFDITADQWLELATSDFDGWSTFPAIAGNDLRIMTEHTTGEETTQCYHLPIDAVNPANGKAELRFQDRFDCPQS